MSQDKDAVMADSQELREKLEDKGLKGHFMSAQIVKEAGRFEQDNVITFHVKPGTYIAVMNSGKVVIGDSAENTADLAFRSGPGATMH
ncbi:MAG: hypothetical protein H6867_00245 [Rhodospirillales bacterium]|nr:hypothetical protein [Rhodospirillales bacterium]MCB9996911.1 hypothetical protein [Rhodospirillales bacterium]